MKKKIYLVVLQGNDVFLHSVHIEASSRGEAEAIALDRYEKRTIEILTATALETNLKKLEPVRPIAAYKTIR